MSTNRTGPRPLVHLELHTPDQSAASAFYATLLRWRPELIDAQCGSYLALGLGGGLGSGIVECGIQRPLWLPYVEVDEIDKQTDRPRQLGARVLLEPREGPAGWRSVVSSPPRRRDRPLAAEPIPDPGPTQHGRFDATVVLKRVTPAGSRQVVSTPQVREIALRQPKR